MKMSVHTSASRSAIWQRWTEVEHWGDFDPDIAYAYLAPGSSMGEGATGVLKGKHAPEVRFEIINWHQPDTFTVRLHLPLYQVIDMKRYFEPHPEGSTVFSHEVVFRGGLRFFTHLLLAGRFRQALVSVMTRIKMLTEKTGADHTKQGT